MRRDTFQKSKLLDLPESQRQELRNWLVEEKLTYEQAQQRIKERWGIEVSTQTISKFWQRCCKVVPRETAQPLLIEVRVTRVKESFRVRVYQRSPGMRIFAGGKEVKGCGSISLKRSQRRQHV